MMSFLLLYTTVEFLIEIVYAKERFPEKKAAVLLDCVQITSSHPPPIWTTCHPVARALQILGEEHFATSWV